MSNNVSPLSDYVVLQPIQQEEVSVSGLVIPDSAKEKSQEGKVIAVGPGKINDSGNIEEIDLKVGDVVIYQKFAGTDYEDLIIVRASDVLARVSSTTKKKKA
ncbi:MAG: co-chaperone GroES [Dehalococcoidia bacterium]|jgi:chaperonin GroES|nr:MAG: chaperonin GroES [Chloroflexota bacterium]|tara:strand:+ start:2026 stop:2331 length:306 start_codon:yes stop_codon:yes gene_type:complete